MPDAVELRHPLASKVEFPRLASGSALSSIIRSGGNGVTIRSASTPVLPAVRAAVLRRASKKGAPGDVAASMMEKGAGKDTSARDAISGTRSPSTNRGAAASECVKWNSLYSNAAMLADELEEIAEHSMNGAGAAHSASNRALDVAKSIDLLYRKFRE